MQKGAPTGKKGAPTIFLNKKQKKVDVCKAAEKMKKNNTWDSNVVPHRSTNQA
jgi:hypothetical protein